MPYLINPYGRWVAIDDQDRYREMSKLTGFTVPTPDEEKAYIEEKTSFIESLKQDDTKRADGLYFASVRNNTKDGYGVSSTKIAEELDRQGMHVALDNNGQKVGLLFHNPYSILAIDTPFRILYTMFESDKLPADWRDYLDAADLVIVPSKWNQKVFKDYGVDAMVIPLGYDARTFMFHERHNKQNTREDFVFLHYNAFNLRKGFPEVFKAFVKAFKKDEPVKLVLKTNLQTIPLPITKSEYPNIEIINEGMREKELAQLLHRADCFVFPSRGEGFGIPPLEAMATGLPTIVPNAHGITEYFNEEFMYGVKVKETCPAIYSRYKGQDVGKMVICDEDDLAYKMRWIYDHQDVALQKGALASEYVKQYSFENTARHLKNIIEDFMRRNPDEKPLRNILQLKKVS